MSDQNFDKPHMRNEASLQFGSELAEAIQHINQGIIITGPSQSGKTVLATAVTTLGLASQGMHTEESDNLLPDLSVAGNLYDPTQFDRDTQEDIKIKIGGYFERFQKLPPILMVDEVTPEYVPFLTQFVQKIYEYYDAHQFPLPHLVWVLQGDEAEKMINSEFQAFQSAHHIKLEKKETNPQVNNVGYRVAASRYDKLQQSLGPERCTFLVQQLQE